MKNSIVYKFLKSFKRFYFLLKLLFNKKLYKSKSYFPELKSKSQLRILGEQAWFIIKYNEPNNQYFLYGFDVKSKDEINQYLPYVQFRTTRNRLNLRPHYLYQNAESFNYICLLRDKFYFGQLLSSLNIGTPKNLMLIFGKEETLLDLKQNKEYPLSSLLNYDIDSYCKMIIGECGKDVFALRIKNGKIFVNSSPIEFTDLCSLIKNGTFLIQEKIIQHKDMSELYPHSVNTLRIITCCDNKGEYHALSAVLRVGANGNTVDNWAAGGLVIGITSNGELKDYGFYEIEGKTKTSVHPDTQISFKNYKIPFYNEAIKEAVRLHKLFYGIKTIGWDVAITPQGPCFIEGNDNYEISLNQVADKGLKSEWLKLYGTSKNQI